MLAENGSILIQ